MLEYPKGDTQEISSQDFAKDKEDLQDLNDRVETVNPSDSKESYVEFVNKVENQLSENEFNLTHCPFQNCRIPISKRDQIELKLSWKNLSIGINHKNKISSCFKENIEEKILINDVNGSVYSGETLAIMGSSGSGKTTFLNVLSGKLESKNMRFQGEIELNHKSISSIEFDKITSFVTQCDQLEAYMTPLEILLFYAKIKLTLNTQEIEQKVRKIISQLNLFKCRNSLIGDHIHRGISGGEKKKLSIALSLICDPKIILLDEPTTGLDSASSYEIIKLLQHTAKKDNRIIIFTIHQPSSEIFLLIEKLFLIVNGKSIFYGDSNQVYEIFNFNKLPIPLNYNPFEYLMEITSIHALENKNVLHRFKELLSITDTQEKYEFYIDKLAKNFLKFEKTRNKENDSNNEKFQDQICIFKSLKTKSIFNEILLLLQRDLLISFRNKSLVYFRILQYIGLGIIISILFYDLNYQKEGIQNRVGLIYFSYENPIRWSVVGVLFSFDLERKRYIREKIDNLYSILSYLISKLLLEIPLNIIGVSLYTVIIYGMTNLNFLYSGKFFTFIGLLTLLNVFGSILGRFLGSFGKSSDIIVHIYNIIYIPMVILSGFYSNYKNFPIYLLPLYFISPFNYGFLTLFLNEFDDSMPFYCNNFSELSCQTKELYYFPLDINQSILIVLLLSIILFIANFFIIYKFTKPKF